ncbi:alpha/beta fold hydrolase [Salinimonas lutimaris]|uniref:alpha/beta fold hydrolase n=1 Tax=Salinimonas lutimaris TaxID=914153 RepID=UPI0010C1566E
MKTSLFLAVVLMLFTLTSQARQPLTADDFATIQYDARLTGVSYPFDVRTFRFSSQGHDLEMAYMYLPPEKGFPVVTLLHGKNFNGAYWQNTATWLHDQGYGVLMPDQVGFGKSSKPTDYQYSFAALASNTKALMDKLNIVKTIVVGHSMGGMLATRFALLYDDVATRLVLVNPIGLENYLVYEHYRDINNFYRSELKKSAQDIISYQQKRYYDGQWNSDYASFAEPLIGWVQGPDWPILAKVSALTYDMIFTQPVIEDMQYLTMPVSLILGTRDRTAPGADQQKADNKRELGRYDRLGQQVKVRNDKIRVTELKGLGHLPQIEDFDRFKAPFLEAIARRTSGNDPTAGSDTNE